MASVMPSPARYVCKACRSTRASLVFPRSLSTSRHGRASLREQLAERDNRQSNTALRSSRPATPFKRIAAVEPRPQRTQAQTQTTTTPGQPQVAAMLSTGAVDSGSIGNGRLLKQVQEEALNVLDQQTIPNTEDLSKIMQKAQLLAMYLAQTPASETKPEAAASKSPTSPKEKRGLFGDLQELESNTAGEAPLQQHHQATATLTQSQRTSFSAALAQTLFTLLEDPKVFISEQILTSYTTTITTLNLPEYLPKIFHLYATKPIPIPKTSPVKYKTPSPYAPKYAVPSHLTKLAMDAAISKRDMPLCISIIDTTVSTTPYLVSRFIRRASIPLVGASSIIPLSWGVSSYAAAWQLSWEPDTFFWMCLAGGGAYIGTMGTLLLISVTTWNDHHKRVRWVPGTPMGRRWLREDERYWFDRMAEAWGYRDETRHGEETGEEWEALRERLGRRWMDLDRSSLLPGML